MYALLVMRIEQQVMAERQVGAVLAAAGAEDVTLPTLDGALQDFDDALLAEPTVIDPEQAELLAVLGVHRV